MTSTTECACIREGSVRQEQENLRRWIVHLADLKLRMLKADCEQEAEIARISANIVAAESRKDEEQVTEVTYINFVDEVYRVPSQLERDKEYRDILISSLKDSEAEMEEINGEIQEYQDKLAALLASQSSAGYARQRQLRRQLRRPK